MAPLSIADFICRSDPCWPVDRFLSDQQLYEFKDDFDVDTTWWIYWKKPWAVKNTAIQAWQKVLHTYGYKWNSDRRNGIVRMNTKAN